MQSHDRLAEGRGVAGVKGGVPLAVLVAEADHDQVGLLDHRLGADRVDPGALAVGPEALGLPTERPGAGGVRGRMVGNRCGKADRQPFAGCGDLLVRSEQTG